MIDLERLHTIISNPDQLHTDDLEMLSGVINKHPYFQAARSIYLKGLYNEQSPLYNKELQITAAHTTDRSVLFDFITSDVFIQNRISEQIKQQQEVIEELDVVIDQEVDVNVIDEPAPIKTTVLNIDKEFTQVADVDLFEKKKADVDEVLNFTKNEKHSFHEWLKLTGVTPIDRDVSQKQSKNISVSELEDHYRSDKMKRIDEFLAAKPKITPRKTGPIGTPTIEPLDSGKHLMTETLAKVYLAQKNYDKAIKSYAVLKLQHPEKSGFFADRIREIENLQSNN
ncbi:hypothetical protein [Nonlabens antarcticus]|uniref:hypothetical protein n=1 Tax=Nonlabens antarcticus TaxID=392714 RepID=UPI001890DC62|nr:hypothetical protein [Nonlabens antarcticus]